MRSSFPKIIFFQEENNPMVLAFLNILIYSAKWIDKYTFRCYLVFWIIGNRPWHTEIRVSWTRLLITFYFEWEGKCDYLLFLRPHDKSVTFLESNTGSLPKSANDFPSKYDVRPWFSTLSLIFTILPSLTLMFTHRKLLYSLLWLSGSNPQIFPIIQLPEILQLVN